MFVASLYLLRLGFLAVVNVGICSAIRFCRGLLYLHIMMWMCLFGKGLFMGDRIWLRN